MERQAQRRIAANINFDIPDSNPVDTDRLWSIVRRIPSTAVPTSDALSSDTDPIQTIPRPILRPRPHPLRNGRRENQQSRHHAAVTQALMMRIFIKVLGIERGVPLLARRKFFGPFFQFASFTTFRAFIPKG